VRALAPETLYVLHGETAQAVKTTPHNKQGKGATLVLGTVNLLHHKGVGKHPLLLFRCSIHWL
jgi:hypothetical protein